MKPISTIDECTGDAVQISMAEPVGAVVISMDELTGGAVGISMDELTGGPVVISMDESTGGGRWNLRG